MTYDYIGNICAFTYNDAFSGTNIQGYRKGLFVELFAMFFIYFLSQILHTFRYKSAQSQQEPQQQPLRASQRQSAISQPVDEPPKEAVKEDGLLDKQKEDPRPELPWNERKWNRLFPILFSNHAIALGMLILFSPFAGGLICAYMHLIFFIIYLVSELMIKKLMSTLLKVGTNLLIFSP